MEYFLNKRLEYTPLHRACKNGDLSLVKELIKIDGVDVNEYEQDGSDAFTPLHSAILGLQNNEQDNRSDIIKLLLDTGADVNAIMTNFRDHEQRKFSPLNLAVIKKFNKAVQLLLEFMHSESKFPKDDSVNVSFYTALEMGNFDIVKLLLSYGVDPNKLPRDSVRKSHSPLHYAAMYGNIEMIKIFKNDCIFKIYCPGSEIIGPNITLTPLHYAMASGNIQAVQLLLNQGANPLYTPWNKRSSLHFAASGGNVDIIKLMLNFGIVYEPDIIGITPLHMAASKGHIDIVQHLLELGIKPEQKDRSGKNSLHVAASASIKETNNLCIFLILLEKLPNIHITDNDGHTYLHQAAIGGQIDIVKYLMEKFELDVNKKDSSGKTSLHMAANNGHSEICEFLLSNRADVYLTDMNGYTSLHCAVVSDNIQTIQVILNYTNNINIKDNIGQTPLILSRDCNNFESIIEILLGNGADVHCVTDSEIKLIDYLYNLLILNNNNKSIPIGANAILTLIDYGYSLDEINNYESVQILENSESRTMLDNYSKFLHFVLFKLKAAHLAYIDIKNDHIVNHFRYKMCQNEVQKMKNYYIHDKITLLDFLKSPLKISSRLVQYDNVVMAIEENLHNCIIYSDLLEGKLKRSIRMRNLNNNINTFFNYCIPVDTKLNDDCIENIINYLSISDLIVITKVIS